MNYLLYYVSLYALMLYAIFSPSLFLDRGRKDGMEIGRQEGMIECKLKPKECDKQFEIYQKEQEIKNIKQLIKNIKQLIKN